jgi:hypothetical protein
VLGSDGNVPVERTAMLIHTQLAVQVSAGFVARAAERLADKPATAGFDEAMQAALRARGRALRRRKPGQRAGKRPRRGR